ncbi:semaphorin-5B isoform X1 [Tachysurus ichikawai]
MSVITPQTIGNTLNPWISTFSHPGVRDYSQLTLDLSRNELIVGARNYLFRLSLSNISLVQVSMRRYTRAIFFLLFFICQAPFERLQRKQGPGKKLISPP